MERRTNHEHKLQRIEDNGATRIGGYASVFYREDEPGTEFELFPGLIERIDPGAFDRALREKDDARALFNHDPSQLLARVESGTLDLRVDPVGLWYEFDVDRADVDHERVLRKLERGDLSGSSFGFIVDAQRFDRSDDGPDVRTILSVQLFDVSPVTYPAYSATTAGTRAVDGIEEARAAYEAWKAGKLSEGRLRRLKRLHEIELQQLDCGG